MSKKKCHRCGDTKPLEEFGRRRGRQQGDGRQSRCKECQRELNREWYANRKNDPEFQKKNAEKLAAWAEKHPEKRRQVVCRARRKYLRANPASARKLTATRRARKKNAFVEVVDHQVVYKRDGGTCYMCQASITFDEMHVDHVIPLAKGGEHSYANCKCACAHCNLSKGAAVVV